MRYVDETELLETFESLARLGSLSRVAEELNISKSAVSRRINTLEKRFGAPLFIKETSGCLLSPLGCCVLEKTTPLLNRFRALCSSTIRQNSDIRGTIRISAPSAIGNGLLIPWITVFQKKHPEVSIHLSLTLGPMQIIPPECDIRINHGLYPCVNARIQKLGEMRRMMVASVGYLSEHGYPDSPADLEKHDLLGANDLLDGSPLVLRNGLERAIVPYHPKLRLCDHTAARTAALVGAGISVHAFRYDTLELVRKKLLVHVLPQWEPTSTPVSLLLPAKKHASESVLALCRFIKDKWKSNPQLTYADHE